MSRPGGFTSPFLIGFDQVERVLDRVAKGAGDGYPPYNIERLGADTLRVTVAVAGFRREELSVILEDKQLVIRGRRAPEPERVYLHRGIAARHFQRSFVLADGLEVAGATLEHGLLHIDLRRPEPNIKVQEIAIADGTECELTDGTAAEVAGPGRAPEGGPAG